MDEKERIRIMEEVRKHIEEAKKNKSDVEITVKGGETSSLSKMIRTKEQAEFFMKVLRAL
jgi:hypothetical protein